MPKLFNNLSEQVFNNLNEANTKWQLITAAYSAYFFLKRFGFTNYKRWKTKMICMIEDIEAFDHSDEELKQRKNDLLDIFHRQLEEFIKINLTA